MKRATIFSCIAPSEVCEFMYERFKDCAPKEFSDYLRKQSLQLVFDPQSPQLKEAISWANHYKESFSLYSIVYYTKRELASHPFFALRLSNPLRSEYKTPKDYGTKYADCCPHCGLWSKREGSFLVNGTLLRRQDIGLLDQEVFVSQGLRQVIEEHGLTGLEFRPEIEEYRGRVMPPYYVAHVQNILPPVSITTWTAHENSPNCVNCGHDVLYLRSDLQYEAEKLADAKDFNLTCEYFNNYREPFLVVSRRVLEVFRKQGIRCYSKPVTLLDDCPIITIHPFK